MEKQNFLSITDVMAIVGVTRKTALSWVHNGILPAARIGQIIRVKESDLEKLLNTATKEATQPQNTPSNAA